MMITRRSRLISTFAVALLALAVQRETGNSEEYRISGPFAHHNLAVYLVRGKSGAGPVPMTLQEATANKTVRVVETGRVHELMVENRNNNEVFIQAGEIVKGGEQDRAMAVSILLPPRSGAIPVAAFCVESARWSARGAEDPHTLRAMGTMMPPRGARELAFSAVDAPLTQAVPAQASIDEPAPASHDPDLPSASTPLERQIEGYISRLSSPVSRRQALMWLAARRIQADLSQSLRTNVVESKSPTSLALTLDNEHLHEAENAFVDALRPHGLEDTGILGYVFAVNGRLNSAEIYSSNGLFRKMWPKLLRAGAAEAIAAEQSAEIASPSIEDVKTFLDLAGAGAATTQRLTSYVIQEVRDEPRKSFIETKRSAGSWVARSYHAK
jgi:hypothetical protein